jgi:hypothetical protein
MLLDRLPSMGGSRYVAARRADPDLAEAMLDLQEAAELAGRKPAAGSTHPPDAEFTREHELLTQVIDLLGTLIAVEASHPLPKGAKPKKSPPPRPRPMRGVDIARARRRNRYLAELETDVEAAQQRWLAKQQAKS